MNPPLDGRVQSGILAVDAGGSGTRVRHTAGSSQVTTAAAPWTAGDRVATLGSCIAAAWSEMGAPETAVVSIGAAATPASTLETARLGRLVCEAVGAEEVLIANDALTAHLGALGGVAGVSLIVGTGVACLVGGADPETPPKVVEGHGYLIGDIGSAFWIGRHAVRAVLDAHQAGAPISPLGRLLEEQWGDLSGASYRIHALPDPVSAVAGLAPAVTALVERDELAPARLALGNAAPESRRMIHVPGVRQLMAQQVPHHIRRLKQQGEVQGNHALRGAAAPARALRPHPQLAE